MPGLGSFALAGAVGGVGQGLLDMARQRREDALLALERQWDLEDAERNRRWDMEDYERLRGDVIEDRTHEEGREDASAARAANVYESLFGTESGGNFGSDNGEGYVGRSQFGQARLDDWAAANGTPRITIEEFRQNPGLQEEVERWHFQDINDFIDANGLMEFEGRTIGGVPITRSGMIAMAHLGGNAGMKRFLESGGEYDPADSNGTNLSDYARTHGGLPTDMSEVWAVLADPNVEESVKDDLRRGLGVGSEPQAPTNQYWRDNGDGTRTRMGTDPSTGATVVVRSDDGEPVVERESRSGESDDPEEPSEALRMRAQEDFANAALPANGEAVVLEEAMRLRAEEDLSEQDAYAKALSGMVFAGEQGTDTWGPGNEWEEAEHVGFPPPEGEWSRKFRFTGEFRYGAGQAVSASESEAAPVGDDAPVAADDAEAAALAEARMVLDEIARMPGLSERDRQDLREAVLAQLSDAGYSTEGL